ncbi:hypothetical protein ITJ54_04880 [Curtobacterium sp. VKM Ac-2865]|uniref:hypothetical protein n=1 Tax=Curtobacterium sp. VKM Ac-2865 TaxID=2783817 RepID=UPI00188D1AAB|nr:hypothetical protein [Curtobacterium sp. VKM Ac-2865]MBF4581999.1 hypothetical protein [Curtobacterium sp. VKM Ac-2865]
MTQSTELQTGNTTFSQILNAAARLPAVRINRAAYLRSALRRQCSSDQIELAIAETPAEAGIPASVIKEAANVSISYEATKVTGLSALAGIPGGLAMVGTVPADMAQYVGHMLRIAQKLAYLHSWPDLFDDDEVLDEATESILTLFVGVMLGVQIAQGGVTKTASLIAAQVAKQLPQKALTKGLIYPIVKRVSAMLGVQMTKKIFASGLAKAIPVAGAVLSGGLTLSTFLPMARKLRKHLAGLELASPVAVDSEAGNVTEQLDDEGH